MSSRASRPLTADCLIPIRCANSTCVRSAACRNGGQVHLLFPIGLVDLRPDLVDPSAGVRIGEHPVEPVVTPHELFAHHFSIRL